MDAEQRGENHTTNGATTTLRAGVVCLRQRLCARERARWSARLSASRLARLERIASGAYAPTPAPHQRPPHALIMSIEESLVRAVALFKQAQYRQALEQYNALVRRLETSPRAALAARVQCGLTPHPLVGPTVHPRLGAVLDQRAATHEKLGDLGRALADSERLIAAEPLSCKGYLRAAKCLQLQARPVEAYKVLQRGVYTIEAAVARHGVAVPERLFGSLKAKYRALNHELKRRPPDRAKRPRRLRDPFEYLPLEVLSLIFTHLPLRTTLALHLVCRAWYAALTSIAALYQTAVFKDRIEKGEFVAGLQFLLRVLRGLPRVRVSMARFHKPEQWADGVRLLSFQLAFRIEAFELRNPQVNVGELLGCLACSKPASTKVDPYGLRPYALLKRLCLAVSGETKYIPYLLGLSAHLTELEITQLAAAALGRYLQTQLECVKDFFRLRIECSQLQKFAFIGAEGPPAVAPSLLHMMTQSPSQIRSLTVVSQDLQQLALDFARMPHLEEVYFENNANYSLSDFVLGFTAVGAPLRKLVFRERDLNLQFDVSTMRNLEFPRLSQLELLDVYGCNLTREGLYRLMACTETAKALTTLNIGNSRKLSFQIDTIRHRSQTTEYLSISRMLQIAPNLTRLYLNEMDFDNFSAKMFYRHLRDYGLADVKLKYIDLSFARVDGTGLMDLFFVSATQGVTFTLDELVLDGIDINHQTIQLLVARGYVGKVSNDFRKSKWKEFGKTTLIQ